MLHQGLSMKMVRRMNLLQQRLLLDIIDIIVDFFQGEHMIVRQFVE